MGSTILDYTTNSITVGLDSDYNWTEETNYTLTINDLPTPEESIDTNLASYIISIGDRLLGSVGWSDSQLYRYDFPEFTLGEGLTELSFDTDQLTVSQGTYSEEFCIYPGEGNNFG